MIFAIQAEIFDMTDDPRRVRHELLMTQMADRNGADLDLALQMGVLSEGEVQAATHACLGCTEPEACADHLMSQTPGIPGYCRNTAMINRVQGLMPVGD